MSRYRHLARYKKPGSQGLASASVIGDGQVHVDGRIWNLRTGEKSGFVPGFNYSRDGRYMRYGDNEQNELVFPDGRVASFGPQRALNAFHWVGPYAVIMDGYSVPFTILDENGKDIGKLPQTADNPGIFNPHDGKTLWFNEDKYAAQYDVGAKKVVRKIDAPKGTTFSGLAVSSSGHVLVIERQKDDTDTDVLALYDASNKRIAERAGTAMDWAPLGDRWVVSYHLEKKFRILDNKLEVIEDIPMFECGRDGHNGIEVLPSGREWVAVGGRGEWDHYGEASLAAAGAGSAGSTSAAKKPAAKRPGAKKSANKPAVKKPAAKKAASNKPASKKAAAKKR